MLRQKAAIQMAGTSYEAFQSELRMTPFHSRCSKARSKAIVVDQPSQAFSKNVNITGREKEAAFLVQDQFRNATHVGTYGTAAGGHRLK